MKQIISIIIISVLMILTCNTTASAETKVKTVTYSTTYHDSIITSWNVGKINSYYTFSYDTTTKKLVNQKAIAHSTSDLAIACSFTDIKHTWNWYNTKDKSGTGRATSSWRFGCGIKTSWIELGSYQDGWMGITVKGNGTCYRN